MFRRRRRRSTLERILAPTPPRRRRSSSRYSSSSGSSDSRECYLYVIQSAAPDMPIKIGISVNPDKRIAQLQTGHPYELRFLYIFRCASRNIARQQERRLHSLCSAYAMSGEWFQAAALPLVEGQMQEDGASLKPAAGSGCLLPILSVVGLIVVSMLALLLAVL